VSSDGGVRDVSTVLRVCAELCKMETNPRECREVHLRSERWQIDEIF
jgi:hypothetical protein